jgi:photosystem II stability/assembly factor-like uncharacterized protein
MVRSIRFFILPLLLLLLLSTARGQEPIVEAYPDFSVLMHEPGANFFEIQQRLNDYWSRHPITKGSGYKQFKRWENYWSSRVGQDGSFPDPALVLNEYAAWQNANPSLLLSPNGTWTELGPISLPANGTSQPNGLGRLNAVAFHPTASNTLWVGSPSGGLWKTTDGGSTWTSNTDSLPTLGVSAILIDPVNPLIMYLGSGDRDAGDAPGLGVFKSSDGGQSWFQSNSGMGNKTISRLLMHPSNSNHILAASSEGIYRSTDGGSNWTLVSSNTSYYKDMVLKPGSTTVYASASGVFYRSTDFGLTWAPAGTGLPSGLPRLVIATTAANANYVYCLYSASDSRSFGGLYRSTDSGLSFTQMSSSPNIMGYSFDGSSTGGQAWYDMCMAADPLNANTIYVGGINVWKSVNGGGSWSLNAHWVGDGGVPAVHADIHDLAFSPLNGKLYNCNDGGLYSTSNGGTNWIDISSGLAIAQAYKIGQSASVKNLVINGYQDNGTAIFSNGTWATEIGGDGMECIVDPANPQYMYGALYYGDIRRSDNGGQWFSTIAEDGFNGINESGAWVTPYVLAVNNANTMYVGYNNLWRSTNVKAANISSIVWTKISNLSNSADALVLEQSIPNPDIMYMVRSNNALFRTDNLSSAQPAWIDLSSNLPNPTTPTDILTHPTNQSVVIMTQSNKVYMSFNKGQNWTNISANLPNVNMNCLAVDTVQGGSLFVGSDLGVYHRSLTGTNWTAYSDGLPLSAEITELEIYYHPTDHTQSVVRAATYGRGLWSSDLPVLAILPPVAGFEASDTIVCTNDTVHFSDLSIYGPGLWQWSITPTSFSFVSGNASSQNPSVVFHQPGLYSVSLMASNGNGSNTLTRTDYIKVGGLALPFSETFETSDNRARWEIRNPDASYGWTNYTVAGNTPGTTAMGIEFFSYSSTGQRDTLISPPFNLTPYDSVLLSFQHAYALYSTGYIDSLFVSVSASCGEQWTRIMAKGDNGSGNFATSAPTISSFTPALSADWCGIGYGAPCISLDLSPWAGMQGVRVMFHTYNGYSNNLYIDNVNLSGYTLSLASGFSTSTTVACPGDTVFLYNNSLNATSYKWFSDGVQFSTASSPYYIVPSSISTISTIDLQLVAYDSGTGTDTSSFVLQVNIAPNAPLQPAGLPLVCNGGNGSIFTVSPVPGAVSYQWNVLPVGAATVSSTGPVATIAFNGVYVGQADISVSALNQCGSSPASPVLTVQVIDVPDPVTQPTGPSFLCKNPGTTTYSISPANMAFTYQWILSPSSAGSFSGNDTVINISWDSNYVGVATLMAAGVNPCGVSLGIPDTITVGEEPAVPNTPGGPLQACQNSDTTTVFVLPVSFATAYTFELVPPSAGSITNNQNEAYINWDNSFTGSAQIRANASNACGTSNWSAYKSITVRPAPAVPSISRSNDTLYSSEFYGNVWYNMSGSTNWTLNYFVPPAGGYYYVVVTNGYGCSERSTNFWYSPVGLDEATVTKLKLFPNPAESEIWIEGLEEDASYVISDALGREVLTGRYLAGQAMLIGNLSVGMYNLRLINDEGRVYQARFVKSLP